MLFVARHDPCERMKEIKKERRRKSNKSQLFVGYHKMLNASVNLCRASYSFKLNLELMRDFFGFAQNKRFYKRKGNLLP